MKAREFDRLTRRYLLPLVEGYRIQRGLIFKEPVEFLLSGFCYEPSGFDRESFHLTAFVQPLYVPIDFVAFTFGTRLGSWSDVTANERDVMADVAARITGEGLRFLKDRGSLEKIARLPWRRADGRSVEAIGYALVLLGRVTEAREVLTALQTRLRTKLDEREWIQEMLEGVTTILELMNQSLDAAIAQLHAWRDYTFAALKLYPQPRTRRVPR